jgi:arginase
MLDIVVGNVHLDLGAGRRGVDMGPSAIHLAGLKKGIQDLGHRVVENFAIGVPSQEMVEVGDSHARYLPEIAEVCRQLADRVEHSLELGRFPVILGGDHSVAIGTISGIARYWRKRGRRIGVIWADAHTDMNTPATSPSGNIHGMPLAVLLGHGPKELVAIAGDSPALDPRHVCVIGARDVDSTERALAKSSGVRVFTMSELDERGTAACVREAVDRACDGTVGVHLSFDLDGVDPQHAPGVGTPVQGGLDLRESHLICEKVAQTEKILGVELVELNPVLDQENRTGKLAVWLILSALGKRIM